MCAAIDRYMPDSSDNDTLSTAGSTPTNKQLPSISVAQVSEWVCEGQFFTIHAHQLSYCVLTIYHSHITASLYNRLFNKYVNFEKGINVTI